MAVSSTSYSRHYPPVPAWEPSQTPWRVQSRTVKFQRGTQELLRRLDILWPNYAEHEDDPLAATWTGWEAEGRKRRERYVAIELPSGAPIGIWLDSRRPLRLEHGEAYRVDFLMVRPDLRGAGVGRALARAVLERARSLGAERIVFHATPGSRSFWVDRLGAVPCNDWWGSGPLRQFPTELPRLELAIASLESEQLRLRDD